MRARGARRGIFLSGPTMTAARRRNLAQVEIEYFKPPVFKPDTTQWNRFGNWVRRAIDLQAGSIWAGLQIELAQVHGTLLDVGCGAQLFRSLAPREVVYRGIDTSDAKLRFGYELPDVEYFDGEDWPVAPGAFDVVLCTEVLEHIVDPRAFLHRAHQALRPGGRLLLTVPFAARWHFIPYDYWRYTPSGLGLLLEAAGFDDVVIHARGNPLTVACYKAMALPLMLIFGGDKGGRRALKVLIGLALSPLVAALALVGSISLRFDWGHDCLGYTVIARRPQ